MRHKQSLTDDLLNSVTGWLEHFTAKNIQRHRHLEARWATTSG
jgi:hypothetical protein